MSAVLLFGIFFALLFLNVPIAMSLGVSSIITTMAVKPAMMSTIAANLYSSKYLCSAGDPVLHSCRQHHGRQRHIRATYKLL